MSDGWTESSNDPLEGLEEEDLAVLVENMKYLEMAWPLPGEEGIDEQQCGHFYEKCVTLVSGGVEVIAQPNTEEPATLLNMLLHRHFSISYTLTLLLNIPFGLAWWLVNLTILF
jgi:hypothetical protein